MLTMYVKSRLLQMLRAIVLMTNHVIYCSISEPQPSSQRHTCLRFRPKCAHSSSIQGKGRLVFLLFTRILLNDLKMIDLNYSLRLEPLNLKSGGQTVWAKFRISYFSPLAGQLAVCHDHFRSGFPVTAHCVGST